MTPRNSRSRWASTETVALFLTAIHLFTPLGRAEEVDGIQKPRWMQLGQAYGFLLGQQKSLAQIEREFPELRPSVRQASFAFYSSALGDSLTGIEDELSRLNGEKWPELKSQMDSQMAAMLRQQTIDREQAQQFLDEVTSRAKGNMPEEMRSTLLSTVPRYVNHPAEELLDGWRQRFRAKGHPKAKGIDFSISMPASWSKREGNQPNVMQLFQSAAGHGPLMATLMVTRIQPMIREDLDEFYRPESLSSTCVTVGRALSAATITLNGRRAGMVLCEGIQQQLDMQLSFRSTNFVIVNGRGLIQIQFTVFKRPNSLDSLDKLQTKAFPLFQAVANSLILYPRYE